MNNDKLIAEQNIVIAEFMGSKVTQVGKLYDTGYGTFELESYHPHGHTISRFYTHKDNATLKDRLEKLQYHTSFDWLMKVVEKIETMDYGFKMCRKVVEVYIDSTKETIITVKESSRMESLYKAVIQFLTWHNANKTNSHE